MEPARYYVFDPSPAGTYVWSVTMDVDEGRSWTSEGGDWLALTREQVFNVNRPDLTAALAAWDAGDDSVWAAEWERSAEEGVAMDGGLVEEERARWREFQADLFRKTRAKIRRAS